MTKWIELAGSRRRTGLIAALGLVASAALLWFALRKVSYQQMADAIAHAHWGWMLPALVVLLAAVVARSVRWRLLFDDPGKLSVNLSIASTNIGVLFNNLLPQRAGELTRIVAVKQAADVPRVETAATIVAERLVDVFVLGTIGLAFWPLFPDKRWVTIVEFVCIAATLAPVIAVASLSGFRRHLPGIVQRLIHKIPRVGHERSHQFTKSLADGTRVLLKPRRMASILALSFLTWGLMACMNWFVLRMFDFNVDAVPAAVLVLVAVNFASAVPVAPGAVGAFEAATQASLVAFGLNASEALSYAVILHAVVFFPFVLLGGLGMLTVRRMSKARAERWGPTEDLEPRIPR